MAYSALDMRSCTDNKERVQCAFGGELALIRSPELREFVKNALETLVPDYFWTVPASTTGKYHPGISLSEGGLVRHTKLAVWWASRLIRICPAECDLDEAIAALLLHDILKNGDMLDSRGFPTIPNASAAHGIYAASKLVPLVRAPAERRVATAVRNHMGRWTEHPDGMTDTEFTDTMSPLDAFVHLCDYVAAQKVDAAYSALEATRPAANSA